MKGGLEVLRPLRSSICIEQQSVTHYALKKSTSISSYTCGAAQYSEQENGCTVRTCDCSLWWIQLFSWREKCWDIKLNKCVLTSICSRASSLWRSTSTSSSLISDRKAWAPPSEPIASPNSGPSSTCSADGVWGLCRNTQSYKNR